MVDPTPLREETDKDRLWREYRERGYMPMPEPEPEPEEMAQHGVVKSVRIDVPITIADLRYWAETVIPVARAVKMRLDMKTDSAAKLSLAYDEIRHHQNAVRAKAKDRLNPNKTVKR